MTVYDLLGGSQSPHAITALRAHIDGTGHADARDGSRWRTLADIVGVDEDPSLQLAGVGIQGDVVSVKVSCTNTIHVLHFAGADALGVVTDLIDWSNDHRDPP